MADTNVLIAKTNELKSVEFTSLKKPMLTDDIIDRWQKMAEIMANAIMVPTGLIMKLNQHDLEVIASSSNIENQYAINDSCDLNHGLYCETTIGNRKTTIVDDAPQYNHWKDNIDAVEYNLVSYLGMPIVWSDGEIFGTICVLDIKENAYSNIYISLMEQFKHSIEKDLQQLINLQMLERQLQIDYLTNCYSRRKLTEILEELLKNANEQNTILSISIIDIDDFKMINDKNGHIVGDYVLKEFSKIMLENLQEDMFFGRLGGDEFMVIHKGSEKEKSEAFMDEMQVKTQSIKIKHHHFSFSYGTFEMKKGFNAINAIDDMLRCADNELYINKKKYKQQDPKTVQGKNK
jgi:diguanylate cyclase (GGDEF)-like protein